MQRRNRDYSGVIFLIHHLIFTIGIENIPPVTLSMIGVQAALYTGFIKVPWRELQDCCISTYSIIHRKQYYRFFSSALEHTSSMHMYYNCIAFFTHGVPLERMMGGPFFAYLLFTFTLLTGMVSISINYALSILMNDAELLFSCAVGFSGVIFALRVVSYSIYPNARPAMGNFDLTIPGGAGIWIEFLLVSIFTPRSSIAGHLAGILVGIAYSKGYLHPIYDAFGKVLGHYPHRNFGVSQRRDGGLRGGMTERLLPPIATFVLMAILSAVFYHHNLPEALKEYYRYVGGNCLNSYLVFDTKRWSVLFTAPLHTLNRLQLAYSLLTLYKVGSKIERTLGFSSFVFMIAIVTAATGLAYIGLIKYVLGRLDTFAGLFPYEMKYKCFMGPTAILLALKVIQSGLLPYSSPSFLIFDVRGVPLIFILIAEAILLQFLFPQAWPVGNIAGILTGLSYTMLL